MNQSVKLLKHLTDVNGIAGYEMQVKEAMRNYIEPVGDQIVKITWVAFWKEKC